MKKYSDSICYNLIDFFIISLAIIIFIFYNNTNVNISIYTLFISIIFIIIIHFLKFIKTYFILLEEKLSIYKMINIYLKTTFTTILLPFKLGELFKIYSYGREMKNYIKGFILILVDKLFDAIIICAILIGYSLFSSTKFSVLGCLLLIFILLFFIIYITFPNTYNYLNKFFLRNTQNKHNLFILKVLEILNDLYLKVKEMINGRSLILFILSFIYWLFEMIFVLFVTGTSNIKNIIDYINDSFLGITNSTFNIYIYACVIVFSILFISINLVKMYKRSAYNEKSSLSI